MEEKNYKKIIQAIRDLDIEELRKENNEIEGLIHTQYEKYLKENKKRKQLCSFIENMEGTGTSLSVTDYDFKTYGRVPDNPYMLKIKMQKKELKTFAKKGWKILDTHLGSGSSAIACYNLGYEFVGLEIDKDYYEGALKRLEEVKSKPKLFRNTREIKKQDMLF